MASLHQRRPPVTRTSGVKRCRDTAHICGRSRKDHVELPHFEDVIPWKHSEIINNKEIKILKARGFKSWSLVLRIPCEKVFRSQNPLQNYLQKGAVSIRGLRCYGKTQESLHGRDVEWPFGQKSHDFRGRPLGQFSSILSRRKWTLHFEDIGID